MQYQKTLQEAATYTNFFKSLKKCRRNVGFKFSVQAYSAACIQEITAAVREMRAGALPPPRNKTHTKIRERGKEREITPIDIHDRACWKVVCDEILLPAIKPHLIYDNGASMEGKGTDFARRRLNLFMERAKRRWGAENVWALTTDFENYFGSIPHAACYAVQRRYIADRTVADLTMQTLGQYETDRPGIGICLGSQTSQVMAVAVPNAFDHYATDTLHARYYLRYMDDCVVLGGSRQELERIRDALAGKAQEIGLTLHRRKTRIVRMTKGITFLKIKYRFSGDRTVKQLTHAGIVRHRRKLKKLAGKPLDYIYASMQSWAAHAKYAQSWHTEKEMFHLYDQLYGGYRLTRKYFRQHPGIRRKKKVTVF